MAWIVTVALPVVEMLAHVWPHNVQVQGLGLLKRHDIYLNLSLCNQTLLNLHFPGTVYFLASQQCKQFEPNHLNAHKSVGYMAKSQRSLLYVKKYRLMSRNINFGIVLFKVISMIPKTFSGLERTIFKLHDFSV